MTTAPRQQSSFLRVMPFLAATVMVLVGLRLGVPILDPILFAVILSRLFNPVYSWLRLRRLPTLLGSQRSNLPGSPPDTMVWAF